MRERAPGRVRTRSGRVLPRTLVAVLAAVLATLGLVGMSYSAPAAEVAETRIATDLLSPSQAPWEAVTSPTGMERPAPGTDLSAPETSADADPSPAGADLDPPSEGKGLVALALFVLVLWGVGRRRRAVVDAPSGAYVDAVDHVPRAGLAGQLCPDACVPAGACHRSPCPPGLCHVEAGRCRSESSTVRLSCRAVFSRARRATTQVDARSRTPTGRPLMQAPPQTASPGRSPGRAP